jgi:dTDP-4-dehydrorhamnose reductase
MQNVILLGATGCLGTQLKTSLAKSDVSILSPSRFMLSAEDPMKWFESLISDAGVTVVVNCAAMTGLDACASDKLSAYLINSHLPMMLSVMSRTHNIRVLQISTDNVFRCDDVNVLPDEHQVPNPTTWYGQTKLWGESSCSMNTNFEVLRLPVMFGPENERQILGRLIRAAVQGEVVKAARDIFTTPVFAPSVAEIIKDWIKSPVGFGRPISHLAGDTRLSLFDFVRAILDILGVHGEIQSSQSAAFPSIEKKPPYGGLNSKYLPLLSLREGMQEYAEFLQMRLNAN